ncbi:MAG: signal peptidase II [Deltaproteobacteria bacterium]|nr:signal peptidase II [Deltaproteobacteria bacterium]
MRPWIVRLLIALSVVALAGCDHAVKHAAKAHLEGAEPRPVVGHVLRLQYTENHDTGFGLLRWLPVESRLPVILALQSLGSIALVVLLARRRRVDLVTAAFALLLAGALGNLADRALRGYVVDFIRVPHWPVFNLADVWITAGIGLFLLAHVAARRAPAEDPAARG